MDWGYLEGSQVADGVRLFWYRNLEQCTRSRLKPISRN